MSTWGHFKVMIFSPRLSFEISTDCFIRIVFVQIASPMLRTAGVKSQDDPIIFLVLPDGVRIATSVSSNEYTVFSSLLLAMALRNKLVGTTSTPVVLSTGQYYFYQDTWVKVYQIKRDQKTAQSVCEGDSRTGRLLNSFHYSTFVLQLLSKFHPKAYEGIYWTGGSHINYILTEAS